MHQKVFAVKWVACRLPPHISQAGKDTSWRMPIPNSESEDSGRGSNDDWSAGKLEDAAVCRNKSCRSCFSCAFKRLYEYGLNSSAYFELIAAYHLIPLSVTQVECERCFLSKIGQEQLEALMLNVHGETDSQWRIKWRDHKPVCQKILSTEKAPQAMKTLKSRQYEHIISFLHFDVKNINPYFIYNSFVYLLL